MRFVSYAQEFEDLFIYIALKDFVKIGNYIDVGANDPVYCSVTKTFYDMGWSGINIEPLPDMCALLEVDRPRDINLCIGVGAQEDVMTLHVAGLGSTFSKEESDKWGNDNHQQIQKTILLLQFVYDKYCSADTEIHFLKIDVEGFEAEVLRGIDFNRLRPWLMVVEATEPGTYIPCHEKWEHILLSNGYKIAYVNGINRYYVAEEKSFLMEKFNEVRTFCTQNKIVKMNMLPVNIE